MATNTEPKIKLSIGSLALLWSIFAAVAGVWWQGQQQQVEQRVVTTELTSAVRSLERTTQRQEESLSRFYTASEAARDIGALNQRMEDHEIRIRKIEDKRR